MPVSTMTREMCLRESFESLRPTRQNVAGTECSAHFGVDENKDFSVDENKNVSARINKRFMSAHDTKELVSI